MNDAPTPKTDAILALIPGGQTCDPQLVADELRGPIAELERELAAERALADRLAGLLGDCREDSCELLGERSWWKDESRCGYSKRYDETAENIAKANEALAAWKASRDPNGASQKPFNPIPSVDEIDEHLDECAARSERDWRPLDDDPNNLEGFGPTEDERRENARAIQAMSEQERFDLMFHGPNKQEP